MKITLVYTWVLAKSDPNSPPPEYYDRYHRRFVDTYRRFPSGVPYELAICFCGSEPGDENFEMWDDVSDSFTTYTGQGWDIGAYQHTNKELDCDLVMFMAAPVYFKKQDWLVPFAKALDEFGPGVYGPQASYENYPHIRTGCFACSPSILKQYPHTIDSRLKCMYFESGAGNPEWGFSRWAKAAGYPVKMITPSGAYDEPDWRKPDNIFRKGDQSNLWIYDRHNDIYADADEAEKNRLEQRADGK